MSSYRDEQLKQLEVVRLARLEAVAIFFDRSQGVAARLKAAPSCGTFVGDAEVTQAKHILRDAAEDAGVRTAALNGLSNELTVDESLVSEVIAMLGDAKAPVELRSMALTALQASQFASVVMPRHRPAYKNALRGLLDDPSPVLRQFAAEYLALDRDEYLQRRLVAGLKDASQASVAPELAIQYLAQDLHADVVPLLREIVARPPNQAAKKEALRNLATDPASQQLLVERLRDPNEAPEIRHVCLVALYRTVPELATFLAKEITEDDATDDELKAALLNTLTHLSGNATAPGADPAFDARVAKLGAEAASPPLKQMALSYSKRQGS
jgi:hypothetical protein